MIANGLPEETAAVALFGSVARGDSDAASDRDICVILDDVEFDRFLALKSEIAKCLHSDGDSLSAYVVSTFERMLARGSLFVHHLALESEIIYERDHFLSSAFGRLGRFEGWREELRSYQQLLAFVAANLPSENGLNECDLHVLQMVARNICILLCFKADRPTFGRVSAYEQAKAVCETGIFDDRAYRELTVWHLRYMRYDGASRELPDMQRQRQLVAFVESLLRYAGDTLE